MKKRKFGFKFQAVALRGVRYVLPFALVRGSRTRSLIMFALRRAMQDYRTSGTRTQSFAWRKFQAVAALKETLKMLKFTVPTSKGDSMPVCRLWSRHQWNGVGFESDTQPELNN